MAKRSDDVLTSYTLHNSFVNLEELCADDTSEIIAPRSLPFHIVGYQNPSVFNIVIRNRDYGTAGFLEPGHNFIHLPLLGHLRETLP